jgi:hypothetical protein
VRKSSRKLAREVGAPVESLRGRGVGVLRSMATRDGPERLGELLRRHWIAAVVLGGDLRRLMAVIAVRTEDATPRPDGLELVGAVIWRGVVYGAVDGLLLSAFPILGVFAGFAGTGLRSRWHGSRHRRDRPGRLRCDDGRLSPRVQPVPLFGPSLTRRRLIWSVPTLVTLNPIGAPIAHVGLHVSAVVHSYQTDLFLSPVPEATESRPRVEVLRRARCSARSSFPVDAGGGDGPWQRVTASATRGWFQRPEDEG